MTDVRVLPIDPLDRVTGSCYLVHVTEPDTRLLVDCGAYQDGLDPDLRNDAPFPFDPSRITALLLTHGHYDHCGRLLKLAREGFRGTVIATEETIAIAKVILNDSIRIQNRFEDARYLDALRWRPIGAQLFASAFPVSTDVFVHANRAGHILGAVSFELIIGPKERPKDQLRVLFSGDIGNNRDGHEVQPFLRHIMYPSRTVNLAVMESTYGGIRRDPSALDPNARRARLAKEVREGLSRGGTVIIPAFAIQRAQDLLWDLHLIRAFDPDAIGDAPILLDAPMAMTQHPLLIQSMGRDVVSPNGKVRPAWLGRHVFQELGLDPASPAHLGRVRTILASLFGDRPRWMVGRDVTAADPSGTPEERMAPAWWPVDSSGRDYAMAEDRPRIVIATHACRLDYTRPPTCGGAPSLGGRD